MNTINRNLVFTILIASILPGIQENYHCNILPLTEKILRQWMDESLIYHYGHPELIWTLALVSYRVGCVLGSFLSYFLTNYFGRLGSLQRLNVAQSISLLLLPCSKLASSYEMFISCYFLSGLCIGANTVVSLLFLCEIAPENYRGAVIATYEVALNLGLVLAQCLAYFFNSTDQWHFLFVVAFCLSLLQTVLVSFCPESPKYETIEKENRVGGEEALAWFRRTWVVDKEFEELEVEGALVREHFPRIIFKDLWQKVEFRNVLFICIVIIFGRHCSGIHYIVGYSLKLFTEAGISTGDLHYCFLAIGIVLASVSLVVVFLVDKIGRKPLILISFLGMVLVETILLLVVNLKYKTASIVIIYLFLMSFALGAGGVTWITVAESFPQTARALGCSTAITLGFTIDCLVIIIQPLFEKWMGHYLLTVCTILDLAVFVVVVFYMRELKGKNSIQIMQMYISQVYK